MSAKKNYIWNPAIYSCEKVKYLGSINDDSLVVCDDIIEYTKTIPKKFNEKKVTSKKKFIIYLSF